MDGKQNVIRTVPVYKDSVKRGEVRILVSTNQPTSSAPGSSATGSSAPGSSTLGSSAPGSSATGSSAAGSATNNSSNKRPFRPQPAILSSGPSSTVASSTLAEKEGQSDADYSRMRNHGTPIPCKRSFPPLLASLASSSSPSPPKQQQGNGGVILLPSLASSSPKQQQGNGGVTLLPYSGSPTTLATPTHGVMSGNSGPSFASCSNGGTSAVHTLASLTARSSASSSRSRQNHGHSYQQNHGHSYQQHNQDSEMSSEMTPNSKAKHRYETSLGQLTKKFICLLKDAPEGVSYLLLISCSNSFQLFF